MVATKKPSKTPSEGPLFPEEQEQESEQTQALAVPKPGDAGSIVDRGDGRVFHRGDQAITWIKLIQKTNDHLGTPGWFYLSDTEAALQEIHAIPILIQATRVKWPAGGYSKNRTPECASRDGMRPLDNFPDGSLPLMTGIECSACPYYVKDPRKAAPGAEICLPGYTVFLLHAEGSFDQVLGLRLNNTSVVTAKRLGHDALYRNQVCRLVGMPKSNDKGSWFGIEVCGLGYLSDEQKDYVHDLADDLQVDGAPVE
jgi:hypothetical protein